MFLMLLPLQIRNLPPKLTEMGNILTTSRQSRSITYKNKLRLSKSANMYDSIKNMICNHHIIIAEEINTLSYAYMKAIQT